jgi:hypothetical protein
MPSGPALFGASFLGGGGIVNQHRRLARGIRKCCGDNAVRTGSDPRQVLLI